MRLRLACATIVASAILLTGAGRAGADNPIDRARALGQQAGAAFAKGNWEEARSLYHQALDLYPAPTLGVREARCLVKLGRLVEAKQVYEGVAALPIDAKNADVSTLKAAQADANQELGALKQRLPYLTVRAEGATRAALTLDGVAIQSAAVGTERAVDPGQHTVAGTIDDQPIEPIAVTLAESEHRSVVAKAAAATPAAPTSATAQELPPPDAALTSDTAAPPATTSSRGTVQRVVGFSVMGAGLVGVGVGIGLGVAAGSKHSDLSSACNGAVCPPSEQGTLDSFHSLTVGSTVGYVLGGVFGAGGLVLVLLAPKNKPAATTTGTIEPLVGPGTLGIRGVFQ